MLRKVKISHRLVILISFFLLFSIITMLLFVNESGNLKSYSIENTQSVMMKLEKEKLKVATHSMALSIGEQLKLSTNFDRNTVLKRAIEKIRFENDSSGYYFICENTTFVVHINKSLIGKDNFNVSDSAGVFYIKELHEKAKKGGGFVTYVFAKPGKGTVPKLAYAEMIPGTNLWIATGVYIDNIDEIKANIDSTITKQINASLLEMTLIILGALIFILLPFSLFIRKSILNPLNEAISITDNVSQGNLEVEIDTTHNDEVGILAKKLDNMIVNLKRIVGEIVDNAGELAAASQQISSASEQLSQGSSEQASSTEQVSSSIEEMAANIQQNSENSQQTEKISLSAVDSIRLSTTSAMEAIDAMKKIAEKITIIGDIAAKTDLLAINASIEAARAGEHGKGFAVVASEVRKLAERSQVAANEINELTVGGVEVADKAGKELEEIVPEIEKTAKLVQEITAASLEQDTGANQINSATVQLNQVTQQNAAAAEELAASSKELNSQAANLKEIVSFFKVENLDEKKSKKTKKTKPQKTDNIQKKQDVEKPKSKGTTINILDSDLKDDNYEKF